MKWKSLFILSSQLPPVDLEYITLQLDVTVLTDKVGSPLVSTIVGVVFFESLWSSESELDLPLRDENLPCFLQTMGKLALIEGQHSIYIRDKFLDPERFKLEIHKPGVRCQHMYCSKAVFNWCCPY